MRNRTLLNRSTNAGRSMIEILAVLAIIGILSFGVIAAYSFAVSKHRANQIYDQVDLRATTSFTNPFVAQAEAGQIYSLPGFDETFEDITYQQKKTDTSSFDIIVSQVPQKVCKRLQDMAFPIPNSVTLNGGAISGSCGQDNTFVFSYNALSAAKYTPTESEECRCSGCQSCDSNTGQCVDNDNLCGPNEKCINGGCQCESGYERCQGSCYPACSDGFYRGGNTCECVCQPQECPENSTWDEFGCSCICAAGYEYCGGACHPACTGSGMTGTRDPDTCNCQCKTGTDASTCACPSGYVYINGQCTRMDCRGGPVSYNCYINDMLCGYSCDSSGHSCFYGTCYPDECPTGYEFKAITSPWAYSGGYRYGCNIPGTECYWLTAGDNFTSCFAPTSQYTCCKATLDGACTTGLCSAAECPTGSTLYHGTTATYPYFQYGGCKFENGVYCYPINEARSTWICNYPSGVICDNNCTNPPDCNGNCVENSCLEGQTYDPETGYCCAEGICCDYTHDVHPECYISGQRCAHRCNNVLPDKCNAGNCIDPGCAALGMKFGYISSMDLWGCVDPDIGDKGMACHYMVDYKPAYCLYNGKLCGRRCNYDGTECGEVFMEECTAEGACLQNGSVISNCTCTGQVTTINGVSHCCPNGHTYTNGGCTLISCLDGQIIGEGGICMDKCDIGSVIDDCACEGNAGYNSYGEYICCDTDEVIENDVCVKKAE